MKIKLLAISQGTFSALLSFTCTQRPFGRSSGGWGHMMGYGGYGGILMWLILIILAGVIIQKGKKRAIFRQRNPIFLQSKILVAVTSIL